MKERLVYDTLIIDQSFLYGGYYEKRNYYYCYFMFISHDFLSGSIGVFYKPIEVSLSVVVAIILIIIIVLCLKYKKGK